MKKKTSLSEEDQALFRQLMTGMWGGDRFCMNGSTSENRRKPYATRLVAGRAVSARLVGK